LQVREWNEVEEFDKLIDNNSGDPDTIGSEPISGHPIDDHHDFKAATPGSTTWIMLGQ
jgi:hypothetical protein